MACMQTQDAAEGLQNFREFSQPLECLDDSMKTQKKIKCFHKTYLSNNMTNKGKGCLLTSVLIDTDFLNTCFGGWHFLLAIRSHILQHINQSKFTL